MTTVKEAKSSISKRLNSTKNKRISKAEKDDSITNII